MTEASSVPGLSQAFSAAGSSSTGGEGYSDERFLNMVRDTWGLKITPQEFQQLKIEVVEKIYYSFLQDIGLNLEKLNEIPPQLLCVIQSPEDYIGLVRLSVLAAKMREYFKQIYDDDSFRMADVFNPKPKRSRKYFAMIYKFLVVSGSHLDEIEEKDKEVTALLEQRDKLNARLEKVKHLTTERKADNTRCEVSKKEELGRLDEKTMELQKCQEEKMVLKEQLDSLNQSVASLNTTRKEMELRIMEAKDEKQKLEGLVIQAGEEEEIRKREMKLTSVKEENKKKKDHQTQLNEKIASKTSLKEKMDKFMHQLQESEIEKAKEKNLQSSIEERCSQILQHHEEIKNQEEMNLQMTQHLTSSVTNFQNKQQTWDLKQKSLRKEIEEKKQTLECVHRENSETEKVAKDITDDVAKVEEQTKQYQERTSRVNAEIKENYQTVLDVMEKKNVELATVLTRATEAMEEFKKLAE